MAETFQLRVIDRGEARVMRSGPWSVPEVEEGITASGGLPLPGEQSRRELHLEDPKFRGPSNLPGAAAVSAADGAAEDRINVSAVRELALVADKRCSE
ncbi:MAG TPA: hypothetical protein VGJ13_03760 [Pseudonocardiaceae bacterium]|jgi:hypothetical protein